MFVNILSGFLVVLATGSSLCHGAAVVSDRKHYGLFLMDVQTQVGALGQSLDRFITGSFVLDPRKANAGNLETRRAVCKVAPNPALNGATVSGEIEFSQTKGDLLYMTIDLTGFPPCDPSSTDYIECASHGFHVHSYGTTSQDCGNAGGHYNPQGVPHGGPNAAVRHVGDFGNLVSDENGDVVTTATDDVATLFGDYNIAGRAMVIHMYEDDLGLENLPASRASGNAGPRVACCSIVYKEGDSNP